MADAFLLFYVTHPDEATAKRIAGELLDARLIACANIFPIASAYWWEGAITGANEWVSVLKTRLSLEKTLEQSISNIHPYTTPCIMRFEVRANRAYLDWIEESTGMSG